MDADSARVPVCPPSPSLRDDVEIFDEDANWMPPSRSESRREQRQASTPALQRETASMGADDSDPKCPPSPSLRGGIELNDDAGFPPRRPKGSRPPLPARENATIQTATSVPMQRAKPKKTYVDGPNEAMSEDPRIQNYAETHGRAGFTIGDLAQQPAFKPFPMPSRDSNTTAQQLRDWRRSDGEAKTVMMDGSGREAHEWQALRKSSRPNERQLALDCKRYGGWIERSPNGGMFRATAQGQAMGEQMLKAEEELKAQAGEWMK